jgi:hypothetical protein
LKKERLERAYILKERAEREKQRLAELEQATKER